MSVLVKMIARCDHWECKEVQEFETELRAAEWVGGTVPVPPEWQVREFERGRRVDFVFCPKHKY